MFALGMGVGRYAVPTKVTENEQNKTETEKEVIEREKTNPDGSIEKEKITKETKKKENTSTTVVENKKPDWRVSGLLGFSLDKKEPVYGIDVQRRILGAASVGIWATTEKTIGLSVGYEF